MGIKRALKINFHLTFSFQQQKKQLQNQVRFILRKYSKTFKLNDKSNLL